MRIECKYDELMPLKEVEKRWHPDNENDHPEPQINSLAKVIAKIGIRHSIHISKQSGKIAGGHGRYLAFKKLGYDEVPIIWENFNDEIEELNYRASDNLGQYAEFNNHEYVLNLEKAGLDLKEIDLEEFGIIDFELPEVEVEPQTDEDEVPEVEHPITRRGDIWLLGNHRLMCGDSTMIDDVEKLMADERADMVFTDPPYGIEYSSEKMNYKTNNKFDVIKNDDGELNLDFLFSDGVDEKIIWGANNFPKILPHKGIWCCWHKRGEGAEKALGSPFELAWCNRASGSYRFYRVVHGGFVNSDGGKRVHPTQKPTKLIIECFDDFKTGNKVLDYFGGSGSTLIACEKTNRKNFSMELDEKYCDVIINRWQNYTGKKATLESTGQTYEELRIERENV